MPSEFATWGSFPQTDDGRMYLGGWGWPGVGEVTLPLSPEEARAQCAEMGRELGEALDRLEAIALSGTVERPPEGLQQ